MNIEEAKEGLKHITTFDTKSGFAFDQNATIRLQEEIKTVLKDLEIKQQLLDSAFDKGFIHKDKIRAKIEKLKEIHKERDFTPKEGFYLDCYEELLDESEE